MKNFDKWLAETYKIDYNTCFTIWVNDSYEMSCDNKEEVMDFINEHFTTDPDSHTKTIEVCLGSYDEIPTRKGEVIYSNKITVNKDWFDSVKEYAFK